MAPLLLFLFAGCRVDSSPLPVASSSAALAASTEEGTPDGSFDRAWRGQRFARAASSDAGALVVWLDERMEPSQFPTAVFAARIDLDGGLLDPAGFRLDYSALITNVQVASDGTNYLVAWCKQTGNGLLQLFGRRYTAAGVPLDALPVQFTSSANNNESHSLTFDGYDYVLTWLRRGSPTTARTLRVDPQTGQPRGSQEVPSTGPVRNARVGGLRGASLIAIDVEQPDGGVQQEYALYFDGGLQVLNSAAGTNSTVDVLGAEQPSPRFVITAAAPGPRIEGRTVTLTGALDPSTLNIVAGPVSGPELEAGRGAVNGGRLIVPWVEPNVATRFVHFDLATGMSGFITTTSQSLVEFAAPAAATLGTTPLLVWPEHIRPGDSSNDDVFFTTATTVGNKRLLTGAAPTQYAPALCRSDVGVFVSWLQFTGFSEDVFARVWRPDAGVWLTEEVWDAPNDQRNVVVAEGPAGRVLSVFGEGSAEDLYAVRADARGARVGSPLAISVAPGTQLVPRLAFDGTQWWSAWVDSRGATEVFTNRVTDTGVLDGTGVHIGVPDSRSVRVTRGPDQVLFVGHTGAGALYWRRGFSDGGLDPETGGLVTPGFSARPGAVFDGVNYVVAWEEDAADGGEVLRYARVSPDTLDLVGPPVDVQHFDDIDETVLAFDGPFVVLGWFDSQERGVSSAWAIRISPDGQLVDLAPVTMTAPGDLRYLTASSLAPGLSVFGFSRFDERRDVMAHRARAVVLQQAVTAGGACLVDADCGANLHCVDGVCCNSTCGGNDPTDCVACSVAAGAAVDGLCQLIGPSRTCRASSGACDLREVCGLSPTCPADAFAPDLSVCATGVCLAGACVSDAGVRDAGVPDAGEAPDAGAADAGEGPDAGNPVDDGGLADAGSMTDGGLALDRRTLAVSCGCGQADAGAMLLLALMVLRRSRTCETGQRVHAHP